MTAREILLEMADELDVQANRRADEYPRAFVIGIISAYRETAERLRAKAAKLPDDVLPKPTRVEVGQMWTRWDDHRTVVQVRANVGATEVDFDNRRWARAEELLTSPDWRYLGKKETR